MAQNIFAQGMDAMRSSYDQQKGYGQDRARIQAGRALANGDRAGAQQAFGRAGLTDDVRQIQGDQRQEENQQYRRDQDAQHIDRAEVEKRAEILKGVTGHLLEIPAGQRKAALQQAYPLFQAAKIDTGMFDPLTEDQLSDSSLQAFAGKVDEQIKLFNTSGGVVAVNPDALSKDMNDPNASRVVYQDPSYQDYRQAQIEATRARAGASSASAEAARARAAKSRARGTGGGSSGAPPALPPGFVWEK